MALFGRRRDREAEARHAARSGAWEDALLRHALPPVVIERLAGAAAGRTPWVATMTPVELLSAQSHGVCPIATVTGTCWFHYGSSWTEGHEAGWHEALERIRREAVACGANAVVDVRMRTLRHSFGPSMDFTLIGTAVRIDGLKPSAAPVIATVPTLEFVRLLEMGIVPTGIAVGARYDWLGRSFAGGGTLTGMWSAQNAQRRLQRQTSLFAGNQPLTDLGAFWEGIRREAHAALRRNAAPVGNGVLAHTQFGQLLRIEQDKRPPAYLGRHIVVGTVVATERGAGVPHGIEPVLDMRDDRSPLRGGGSARHTTYDAHIHEREGPI